MFLMYQGIFIFVFFFNAVFIKTQAPKVAVVTGANKGIGYEIVKGLCEKYDGRVYLTSRDEFRGIKAIQKLKELGLNPYYHQLDVTDIKSIQRFQHYINETEKGIDILINNAGISTNNKIPFEEEVENILKVNYFGLLQVSTNLFPLLRKNGRVINVSSALGLLSYITSNTLRSKLANPTLTISELSALMNDYIKLAKRRKHGEEGWPSNNLSAYCVSKIGVSALTFIQQRNFDTEAQKRNITINCVTPGYVDTDLTDHQGTISAKDGASLPLYLALENHGLRGAFLWSNFKVIDWYLAK